MPGVVEARRRRRRGSDHRAGARRAPSRRQSDAGVGAPGVGADRGVEPAVVLGGPISVSVGLSFFQPTWRAPAPAPRNATRRHRCYARNDSPVNLRCSGGGPLKRQVGTNTTCDDIEGEYFLYLYQEEPLSWHGSSLPSVMSIVHSIRNAVNACRRRLRSNDAPGQFKMLRRPSRPEQPGRNVHNFLLLPDTPPGQNSRAENTDSRRS